MDKNLKARWADIKEWAEQPSVKMYAFGFLLLNLACAFNSFVHATTWNQPVAIAAALIAGMAMREAHELSADEEYEPPRPRPRLVITGNHQQYMHFLREHNADPKEYMYFNNAGHYMGFHNPEVFLWGEYWKAEEVMRYAHQMGWLR